MIAADYRQDGRRAAVCGGVDENSLGVWLKSTGSIELSASATSGNSYDTSRFAYGSLDRLGTAKEIAQLGATIGREFCYELLQAISPLDEETYRQGLKQLVEAELVYQRGLVPQAHYLFKHALIQDTAYQSLLKSTRQQYHQQIAQVLDRALSRDQRNSTGVAGSSLHRGGVQ